MTYYERNFYIQVRSKQFMNRAYVMKRTNDVENIYCKKTGRVCGQIIRSETFSAYDMDMNLVMTLTAFRPWKIKDSFVEWVEKNSIHSKQS